jgi:hypothetical protein
MILEAVVQQRYWLGFPGIRLQKVAVRPRKAEFSSPEAGGVMSGRLWALNRLAEEVRSPYLARCRLAYVPLSKLQVAGHPVMEAACGFRGSKRDPDALPFPRHTGCSGGRSDARAQCPLCK